MQPLGNLHVVDELKVAWSLEIEIRPWSICLGLLVAMGTWIAVVRHLFRHCHATCDEYQKTVEWRAW